VITIKDILQQTKLPHSPTAKLDLELLLSYVLRQNRSFLYAFADFALNEQQNLQLQNLIKRRQNGEPIAYILGSQGFWNLELKVSKHTLIPRPETEMLVAQTLQLLDQNLPQKILDLGTGSGAIALALAANRPKWQIIATDASAGALAQAAQNAQNLHLTNVQFKLSNWFSSLNAQKFNLIVSNPPYIAEFDPHLTQGDVRFEPKSALIAGENGLADLAQIIKQAPKFLLAEGFLLLEHGFNQGQKVCDFLAANNFRKIQTLKDLAGLERLSFGQIKLS